MNKELNLHFHDVLQRVNDRFKFQEKKTLGYKSLDLLCEMALIRCKGNMTEKYSRKYFPRHQPLSVVADTILKT